MPLPFYLPFHSTHKSEKKEDENLELNKTYKIGHFSTWIEPIK